MFIYWDWLDWFLLAFVLLWGFGSFYLFFRYSLPWLRQFDWFSQPEKRSKSSSKPRIPPRF